MSLAVAIQMDPIESVNIDTDSTFVMALEAQRRGHALWHYLPQHLVLRDGRLYARARRLEVRRLRGDHFTLASFEMLDLSTMDIVLMRQDPPFDMAYITATHLLEHIHPQTLVLNDPMHVRNAPEKLFVTHFKDVMPPTLIASDKPSIEAFRAEHGDIVLKPLFGNGGADVFHVQPGDENFNALLELFTRLYREPIIVQRYLPEVRQGDKRIVLVDGRPLGAVARIPKAGEARANLHVGAQAVKSALSERDKEICAAIGPTLKERGLVFVGIDVIGGYLTEINVTSPTGIQEINRLDGTALEIDLWDAIEARFEARHTLRPM
ncbi:MAG TPA: glutathione synthase [Alphaproteobacteria bacterium]|nr:glutathione synthase [Alphaproteobacteria bacterium]